MLYHSQTILAYLFDCLFVVVVAVVVVVLDIVSIFPGKMRFVLPLSTKLFFKYSFELRGENKQMF